MFCSSGELVDSASFCANTLMYAKPYLEIGGILPIGFDGAAIIGTTASSTESKRINSVSTHTKSASADCEIFSKCLLKKETIKMTDPNMTEEQIIDVTPETTAIVKKEMPDATDETIAETAALFEAIKKRATAEVQAAGDITREAYLKAVQKAQLALAKNKTHAKERMTEAVALIQKEAEKNWLVVDAIKTRAQAQVQDAGEVSREAYLKAVRQAREAVEQNKLIERDRIEHAVDRIHTEAEKNWHVVVAEIESLGVRLTDAAKSAFQALTAFFDKKH